MKTNAANVRIGGGGNLGKIAKAAAVLVIAAAAAVAVPSVMATDYEVGAGQTYANLNALKTAHGTFVDLDNIIFHDATDSTLASSFSIASGATLTLSGTATISAANNVYFTQSGATSFSMVVADNSLITFGSFNTTGSGAVIYGFTTINLGTVGSNGVLNFSNNSAAGWYTGGAIHTGGNVNILGGGVNFTKNSATLPGGWGGGAIYAAGFNISGGTVTFTDNLSAAHGGAVRADGLFTISNSTVSFTGNKATGAGNTGHGGAIFVPHISGTISDSTVSFTDNSANMNGGAVAFIAGGSISGGSVSFTNNSAGTSGGAIYSGGNVTLRAASTGGDILFQGNTDGKGTANEKANAIYANAGTLTLAAETGCKIEFFDPITCLGSATLNSADNDIGEVIFDGSYWRDTMSITNPAYFTSKIYGNTTVSYGTLAIQNGAIYDNSGAFTVGSNATVEIGTDSKIVTGTGATTNSGTIKFTGNNAQLTTAAAFNNTGSIDISNSGTLAGTTSLTGAGTLDIASGKTLTASALTASANKINIGTGATFSGAASLANTGTITLTNGTYSGGTLTNGANGCVNVDGTSTITGNFTVGTAATGLEIGDDANLIVSGNVNLTNSKLSIGLNSTDKTTSKLAANTITVGGTDTTNLTFGNWSDGTYTIISATTGTTGLVAYKVTDPGGGMTATLSESGNDLILTVITGRYNDKLTWGTNTNGTWSDANAWKIGGSMAATFMQYDYAAFGAGTGTMDVDTGVDVSGMEVTAGDWTFIGGEITGSTNGDYSGKDGNLVVHSSGSATFENAIDFVAVNIGDAGNTSGKVVIGDTIGSSGSYGGAITFFGSSANNELVYDSSNDQTLSGVISGAGKLTKENSGKLTLSADSSAFTGTFAHNDGGVTLNGAKLGGAYTQASGTTLTAIGTATLGAATFAGTIDLGTALGTNKIAATGAVNFIGATTIDVNSSTNGIYSLITGSSITNATNASIDNAADLTGKREGRKDSSTEISYKIFSAGATALTWTGATDGDWDATTVNWQDSGSYNTEFANSDNVTFGTTATNKTIAVASGGVSVGTMAVNDDYSFTGGKITATGAVTVAAGKTLGLAASNTPALVANSVNFNTTGSLNITGYTPDESGTSYGTPRHQQTVIQTTNGVSNFNSAVTVAGQATADFLSASAALANSNKNVVVETRLTWDSTDPLRNAHGDFTITPASSTFTLGAALADNNANTNRRANWDGTTLTKLGDGTLILTGANSYTGVTTISDGTLQIGNGGVTGSIAGDVVNNAMLAFDRSDAVTFAGAISGTGSVVKNGAGTLTLSGANTYTGGTTISAGTLAVSGNLVVVADTNPDNAPIVISGGAFTVDGTLHVNAKDAQLGALVAGVETPFYFADTDIGLTITGDIDYSGINSSLYTVAYTSGNFLDITKKGGDNPYVSPSVGAAFGSYTPGGGNDLFDDIHTTPNTEYETAERIEMSYNAASHVGVAQQGMAALGGYYNVMENVFSENFAHDGGGVYRGQVCNTCSPACGCSRPERSVWVMPIYGHQSAAGLHSGGVNYGYKSDQYAAVFGTEVKRGYTRFGIAGSVGIGRAVSPGAVVHTNSDLTFGGVSLYATQKFGDIESNAQVGWIGTKNEMRQNNNGVRVNADIDGGLIYAAVGFERPYHCGNLTLSPIFGLEFTHLYQNGFATKAGGNAIFNAQSGNANMLHLPLGLKLHAEYKTCRGSWMPSVRARVLPHVGDRDLSFTNLSTGSTTAATLRGVVSDAVAGDVTFGSTFKCGHTELGGAYTVLFSEHFTNQNVSVMVKRKF